MSRAPVVAVINSNDDLVAAVRDACQDAGYAVVSMHISEIKSGTGDFVDFLQRHEPDVVVYDIALPYDDNWQFLEMLRRLPDCADRPFVVTTVNERALDERVGPTPTIEVRGGHAQDLEPVLDAVRLAIDTGS